MIARDLQPYEFVENKGFQDLIRDLQPQYKIPHRTTFSRTVIPELYRRTVDSLKTQIASDIAKGLESLAFTTDMWTSRANQGYISLTCHYMTQDFAVKAFTLACCHLQESHTAVNIQACLTEIVKEWSLDLSTVPVYVVTDNGRNIRAAVRQMEWIPLQCLGHTLQLAIKDAKEETPVVSSLCKKARALVGHYKHSAQATRRLKDCQKRMELPSIGLIQDVDTRWNSEHAMLSRLVQLRDAVSLEIATSETSVSCPSPTLAQRTTLLLASFPGDFASERVVAPDAGTLSRRVRGSLSGLGNTARCKRVAGPHGPTARSTGLVIKSGFPTLPGYNPLLSSPDS
ncbi:zinc finger BED domain-containing protein 4-like [Rhipicephalus sanguineus]|uniref:zinc finger BED domain-containing protein 4-like n=1 Tax=Rhipicephalus sanguineus TaxID=34632 RepID=UPI001894C3DE|nr:zinc finger BED domain-containing protein 4-like [Rhipicephalus sanguineus]